MRKSCLKPRWVTAISLLVAALLALGRCAAQEGGPAVGTLGPPIAVDAKRDEPATRGADEPAPAAADAKAPADAEATKRSSVWDKVPPVPPLPRIGYFTMPPSGPGYYSLMGWLEGRYRPKAPAVPYPPIASDPIAFYDADWRFLEAPGYEGRDPFNRLHRIHLSEDWMFSVGGEERIRYMGENGGYARFTGVVNDYELYRTRLYSDLWYRDLVRVYVEMQDSRIANNNLPPLPNDVDYADFLNLFADVKLATWDGQPGYVRVGRQELYFGSQRLISPSDFPNVRRTFQGVRAFWRGQDWDVDAFWVHPVLMRPTELDPPDHNQAFGGLWVTHRPGTGQTIDLYCLNLDNSNPVAVGSGGFRGGLDVTTLGSRYAGDYAQRLLWDFEGMYQVGTYANQQIAAGAITTGLGYRFAAVPTVPQFWLYWERASGDPDPGAGSVHRTFNQLFPWGHTYFGYLDLVGRQNINDISMQAVFYPARWLIVQVQYHVFRLVSAKDALYNASAIPLRRDPTGAAGTDVGNEIDFTTTLHVGPHQDILVGYSHFFAGAFIRNTGPAISPSLFYLQYSFKF